MNTQIPKNNKKLIIAMVSYILCPIAVLILFQNCGNKNHSTQGIASLGSGDLITPDPEPEDPDKIYNRRVEANQMVANRILTANYFKSIFGPNIENTATRMIASQAGDFGSGFSIYDSVITPAATCNTKMNIYTPCNITAMKLDAPANIGVNIRREAFRIRTCTSAVKTSVLVALKKIDRTATTAKPPEISAVNLTKAFHLFYRGRKKPSTEILDSLLIVSQKSEAPIDQWKDIILSLCISPHWQVL